VIVGSTLVSSNKRKNKGYVVTWLSPSFRFRWDPASHAASDKATSDYVRLSDTDETLSEVKRQARRVCFRKTDSLLFTFHCLSKRSVQPLLLVIP